MASLKKPYALPIAAGLYLSVSGALAFDPQTQIISLHVGDQKIIAEVSSTQAALTKGLKNRRSLGANEGMLFVFKNDFSLCLWMKDTQIPLSVAFIDHTGTVLNITDMQPLTADIHCAAAPAQFALEMNKGWFHQHGVAPGAKVRAETQAQ